jgi:hypothetical protein
MPSGIVRALASCTRIDVEPKPARRRSRWTRLTDGT